MEHIQQGNRKEKIYLQLESWCRGIPPYLKEAVGQFCEECGGSFQFLGELKVDAMVFLFLELGC